MKKNTQIRLLVFSACFMALSIMLERFTSINVGTGLRFGFGKLPIVFASYCMGPVWGLAVGWCADVLGSLLTTSCFLPLTIPSALIGLLPWCVLKLLGSKKTFINIWVSTTLSMVITEGVLKTLILVYFGFANQEMAVKIFLLVRVIATIILATIESVVIYFLAKSRYIQNNLILSEK